VFFFNKAVINTYYTRNINILKVKMITSLSIGDEEREDPKAAELRVLLRRLYGPVGDQPKFEFANNNDFYLAHALIQMALFSVKQECVVLRDIAEGCINDGSSATAMTPYALKALGEYDSVFGTTDTRIKDNPETRDSIKPETFYFHNCHVENFYSEANLDGKEGFDNYVLPKYANKYLDAKLIWLGIKEPPNNVKLFFQEIKKLVPETSVIFSFDDLFVHNLSPGDSRHMTANQIKEFLSNLASCNSLFGKAVKSMMNKENFKKEYKKAAETSLTKLKNFVVKCLLTIYHSLKWCFTRDTISEAKEAWRKSCEEATANPNLPGFRDYVTSELNKEVVFEQSPSLGTDINSHII
jgi:hypothetical protein